MQGRLLTEAEVLGRSKATGVVRETTGYLSSAGGVQAGLSAAQELQGSPVTDVARPGTA